MPKFQTTKVNAINFIYDQNDYECLALQSKNIKNANQRPLFFGMKTNASLNTITWKITTTGWALVKTPKRQKWKRRIIDINIFLAFSSILLSGKSWVMTLNKKDIEHFHLNSTEIFTSQSIINFLYFPHTRISHPLVLIRTKKKQLFNINFPK